MDTNTNVATWNLCLGLPNKKDSVTGFLNALNIHVCCLQETEILIDVPEDILNCGNYRLELESNTVKKELVFISEQILNMYEEKILKQKTYIL